MSGDNRSFEQILESFEALLNTMVTEFNVVTEVQFGRAALLTGSPSVRFYIATIDTRHVAQRDYRRGWGFRVEIVQEASQKSARQAEIDLGKAVDCLFDLIEENWDLSGDILDDTAGSTSEETRENGKVITASFLIVPRTFTSYSSN